MQTLSELLGVSSVDVVDVGANPIDGPAPYAALLKDGVAAVVGFEPQPEGLARLNQAKGPRERYLPHVVGDGSTVRFRTCKAPGMSSTLVPNARLLSYFHGFPEWSKVLKEEELPTRRLDDLDEIPNIDLLKIDVQGGELAVFRGGARKLADAVAIQTEVNFLPMYEGQALFAELDQHLRGLGFLLHAFTPLQKRCFAPLTANGSIYDGINQVFWADAVYVKDFTHLERLSSEKLRRLALVLHGVYGSVDLTQVVLKAHDAQYGTHLWKPYLEVGLKLKA